MNNKKIFIKVVDSFFKLNEETCDQDEIRQALEYYNTVFKAKSSKLITELGKRIIVCMRNDETHFDNVFGVNEIAENLETTQKSINGALRKLVNDGFVEKINTAPKKYKLTDKGLNEKL